MGILLPASSSPENATERRLDDKCRSAAEANLAELLASSHHVVVGTAQIADTRLIEESRKDRPEYVDVPIEISRKLKGSLADRVTLKVYPMDRPYAPSVEAVLSSSRKAGIFFITQVDEGPVGLYLEDSPAALREADPATIEAVDKEAARQRRLLSSWRLDPTLPYYQHVAELVDELASIRRTGTRGTDQERRRQQRIFDRLEKIGDAGVPAIIAHMDDRRPLAFSQISLVNKNPDAFEGLRHYGPELVVDALDAILNQITGKSFGFISNGGSDRERKSTVEGWRIYDASLRCSSSPAA